MNKMNLQIDQFINKIVSIINNKEFLAIRQAYVGVVTIFLLVGILLLINAIMIFFNIDNTLVLKTIDVIFVVLPYVAICIASFVYCESKNINKINTLILSLVFFTLTIKPNDVSTGVFMTTMVNLSSVAVIYAVIVVIIIGKLFTISEAKKQSSEKIPPAVGQTLFTYFTYFMVIIIALGIALTLKTSLLEIIALLVKPLLMFFTTTIIGLTLTTFIAAYIWSKGMHGVSIIGVFLRPLWIIAMQIAIVEYLNPGTTTTIFVNELFFQWLVWLGGSGASIGCLFAIKLCAKSSQLKDNYKISIWPGIFNINESVMFGVPLAGNKNLSIPLILAPVVITITSAILIFSGMVPNLIISIPWVTPVFIGGYIASGFSLSILMLVLINIIITTLIYLPFIIKYDRELFKKEQPTC